MRATDKILEYIKHIESASKLISSSLGETDLYKAEYLTKHLRGLRDLQIGDVSLLLIQCKTEVESKNYADIISRLTKSCAENISAFEYNEEDLKRCYSMTAIRDQAEKESLLARKSELILLQEALDGAENAEDRKVIQGALERTRESCHEDAINRIKSIEGCAPVVIYDAVLKVDTAIRKSLAVDKPSNKENKKKKEVGRPTQTRYSNLSEIFDDTDGDEKNKSTLQKVTSGIYEWLKEPENRKLTTTFVASLYQYCKGDDKYESLFRRDVDVEGIVVFSEVLYTEFGKYFSFAKKDYEGTKKFKSAGDAIPDKRIQDELSSLIKRKKRNN